MKLCIDARMIDSSGIGTVLKNVIPFLSPFETSLINCKAPIYSIQEQFALPRLISPCDVFWSPHYNIPLFPIRAKKRVVTIHDACHLAFRHLMGWKENLYAQLMFRQAVSRSDVVITDSQFSQRELHSYLSIPLNQIQVIYPGVDFERFTKQSSDSTKDALKKKYGLPDSFLIFVGNVKPHKNLRLILDCYDQFSIDLPLVVVGKKSGLLQLDPCLKRIQESPRLKNQIFLTGDVLDEELPSLYQMATALIFPSLYEGFGLPPLEAMSAGCPTIVSDRASLPEVCGDAAYFIHADRPDELAEAIVKITSNSSLRKQLKQKGVLQARKFSWEKTGREYIKIFTKP